MKRHGLKFSYTFCLGGISCLLFIILTVTGILLMFLYTLPLRGLLRYARTCPRIQRQDLKELASMGCARDGGDCLFAYG